MELTGVWLVFHASDASAHEVAKYLALLQTRWLGDHAVAEGLRLWTEAPESVASRGAVADGFLDAFWRARIPRELFDACADPALEPATWDLAEERGHGAIKAVFAALPGIAPAAILNAGLGPQRAALIPGGLGMFALTNAELEEHAHGLRRAHAFIPQQKAQALHRMQSLFHLAGRNNYPIGNLLEAIPLVTASALGAGSGLIAVATAI